MSTAITVQARRFAPIILPLAAIAAARAVTFNEWAAANAALAALLFAWIVADALAPGLIARAPRNRPDLHAVLGALAAAGVLILLGAAEPVRSAILAMPPLLAAIALTNAAYCSWSAALVASRWRGECSAEAALSSFIPRPLARAILHELGMVHLALFRLDAPRDVTTGAQPFAYHRYLNRAGASGRRAEPFRRHSLRRPGVDAAGRECRVPARAGPRFDLRVISRLRNAAPRHTFAGDAAPVRTC